MKKKYILFLLVLLLSACAIPNPMTLQSQLIDRDANTAKVSYTKSNDVCRPFLFGNPSIAEMAKKVGISEIVTIERDWYVLYNCISIKGN
jgi:hypothetical protein